MRSVNTFIHRAVVGFIFCLFCGSPFLFAEDVKIPQQVQDWQKAAQDAIQQKNHDTARAIYARIIKTYPQTRYAIEAHRETAAVFIQAGRLQEAEAQIQHIKTEFSTHPDVAESLYWVGRHYGWTGQWDTAIQLHEYNVATYPSLEKSMWSQVEIIYTHIRRKDWDRAQAAYENMLTQFSKQPTLPKEIWQISREYANAGQANKALELCRYNAKTFHNTEYGVVSQSELVVDRIRNKDVSAAETEYARMLANSGNSSTISQEIYRIAGVYAQIGNHNKAIALHRYNADTFHNTEHGLLSQGEMIVDRIRNKDAAAAETEYALMLANFEKEPMLAREIYHIAGVYAKAGQTDKSFRLYQYNSDRHGDHDFGRWSSVETVLARIRNKDFAAAEDAWKAFSTRYAKEPTLSKELYLFGQEFGKSGDRDRGLRVHQYNAAHCGSADHGRWSAVEAAFYYIDQGDHANAAPACMDFIQRYADHPDLSMEIRNIFNRYCINSSLSEAKALCETALAEFSENPSMIWMQQGLILVLLDQQLSPEAGEAYAKLLTNYAENTELAHVVTSLGQYCREKYNDSGMALEFYSRFLTECSTHPKAIDVELSRIIVYLDLGAKEMATGAVRSVIEKTSHRSDFLRFVNALANQCRDEKHYAQAIDLYQAVLEKKADNIKEKLCAYAGMAKAQIHMKAIASGEGGPKEVTAQPVQPEAIVEMLITNYATMPEVDFHVFQIGEEYYFLAEQAVLKGDLQKAKDNVQRSLAIWEKSRNVLSDPLHQSHAAYYSAVACGYIGDYKKALYFYKEVVSRWPNYDQAWHAQYMIVDCAEKLAAKGEMNSAEYETLKKTIYSELLTKYPGSPVSVAVRKYMTSKAQ
jgi:tetratricopeptide (TPR) repeat protein